MPDQTVGAPARTAAELLEELKIHQVELEMQNEELRRSHIELEIARDLYADLYEFAPIGYLTINARGEITQINLTGARMLGLGRKDLLNHSFDQFVEKFHAPRWRKLFMDSVQHKAPGNTELQLKRADHSFIYVRADCTHHVSTSEEASLRLTLIDMNEYRKAELARRAAVEKNHLLIEALESHSRNLEQVVTERTVQLIAARDAAEAASRAKNMFLATVSHELRTPLNAIIGFSELLLSGSAGALNPEQLKQLTMIQLAGQQQLELVVDVLDVANIEAGNLLLKLEPVNLREVLEQQCNLLQTTTDASKIALDAIDCDPEILVLADRRRLAQAVRALLSNAIKFTNAGGRVRARARFDGTLARIVVEDTGIGISLEDQTGLFVPFARATDTKGQVRPGTGLGLAICKNIVEAMGGTVGLDSEPGRGSSFWFTVPLA